MVEYFFSSYADYADVPLRALVVAIRGAIRQGESPPWGGSAVFYPGIWD